MQVGMGFACLSHVLRALVVGQEQGGLILLSQFTKSQGCCCQPPASFLVLLGSKTLYRQVLKRQ